MGRSRYGVRDEIKDTAEEFYRAVSKKNLKALDALWAHVPYAAVAGRGGQLRQGWPEVRGYWEKRFRELGDTVVTTRLRNAVSHAVGDVAWLSGTEMRTVQHGDLSRVEELRMTAVLERTGTYWQIVSYHASEPGRTREVPVAPIADALTIG
jgi:ketosteroid isomerase-like protein